MFTSEVASKIATPESAHVFACNGLRHIAAGLKEQVCSVRETLWEILNEAGQLSLTPSKLKLLTNLVQVNQVFPNIGD